MEPSLKFLLYYLRLSGLDPLCQNRISRILNVFLLLGIAYVNVPVYLEVMWNFKGVQTLAKVDVLPAMLMVLVKGLSFYLKLNTFHEIITMSQQFWPIDKFGVDVKRKLLKVRKNTFLFVTTFVGIGVVTSLLFMATPFVNKERVLPVSGYELCDLQGTPCFELQYFFQFCVSFTFSLTVVSVFDTLFLVLTSYTYCTIEVLKAGFQQLDVCSELLYSDLKDLVDQHRLLLRFIRKMDDFYSDALFLQFIGSTGQLIFSLYMITSEGMPPPLPLLSKYGILLVMMCIQLLIFCFGGAVIAEKTVLLADDVYTINWWDVENRSVGFGKDLRYIIEVVQKGEKVTVGKMIRLDLESFVAVLKLSFQVYMLITATEE